MFFTCVRPKYLKVMMFFTCQLKMLKVIMFLNLWADHPGGRFSPPEEQDMVALNLKQTKGDIGLLRNLTRKTFSK